MRRGVFAVMCGSLAIALGFATGAGAQPCAPLPTGVLVEWSACNNGPRINWSLPGGQLILPRVYRSLTPNFADAAVVSSPGERAMNASGVASVQDVFDFLTDFFNGCP